MIIENIVWLLFAHFVGDISLQSNFQASNKGKVSYVMFSHCVVWAGCISVALNYAGCFVWWKFVSLVILHWATDLIKYKVAVKFGIHSREGNGYWSLSYIDQSLHGLQILLVYIL